MNKLVLPCVICFLIGFYFNAILKKLRLVEGHTSTGTHVHCVPDLTEGGATKTYIDDMDSRPGIHDDDKVGGDIHKKCNAQNTKDTCENYEFAGSYLAGRADCKWEAMLTVAEAAAAKAAAAANAAAAAKAAAAAAAALGDAE